MRLRSPSASRPTDTSSSPGARRNLARLAPHVTRTLPQRPVPAEGSLVLDVPRAALGSLVKPKLEQLWGVAKSFLVAEDERMRRNHGGRPPDFGDPKPIIGAADSWMTRHIAVVGNLEKMRVALDVVEDGLSVVTTMTPVAGGGPAASWTGAMKTGDTAPLGTLPATSAVALMTRDSEEARAEQVRELETALASALGTRLADADAKKLHAVLEDATKARGDVLTSALVWDEPQGLLFRGPVRDDQAAARFVSGAVELTKVAPFKEILRVRSVTSSTEDAAGVGKASLVTITREPAREAKAPRAPARTAPRAGDAGAPSGALWGIDAGSPAPPRRAKSDDLGLAWLIDGGVLSLASSDTPLATLSATVKPDRRLSDEPSVMRSLAALGSTSSSVLVVQPLRFDPTRANLPAAPLVVALGRKDKDATLRDRHRQRALARARAAPTGASERSLACVLQS